MAARPASGSMFIQVASHGVSGYAAWKGMVDGMVAAPEKPPHFPLVKEFWAGPNVMPSSINVCHIFDSQEKLQECTKMFAPGGPMGELTSNPIIKPPMTWNQFDVRVVVNEANEVEEGMVLGVYAHGVPDADAWVDLFAGSTEVMEKLGIVKSYGGVMVEDCAWAPEKGTGVMVVHVFKDLNHKHEHDTMFDATAPFFADLIEKGAVIQPLHSSTCGPLFKFSGSA
eukprot:CAMPEP_0119131506 /NCGR_PEP_ID=MMETSP1310-20130426/10422_1 /TAXON_ID=464262 /ORGANISM="Genus nov. species nov., Strain RCC2339" /LENGTH=225 /DNA_ID=CAMNT_0007122083 /DNA_START=16 /DNA_END=693 /DNA_ORIENTATION=-